MEMKERFLSKLRHLDNGMILISSTHVYKKEIQEFRNEVSSGITMIESPAVFDIDGVRGNLRASFLALEDFDQMQAYSGSFVEYDTCSHSCERVYLDLFPRHGHVNELELLMSHLEDVLGVKVKTFRKKKDMIS